MTYFIQLNGAKTTINLAEITMVEWEGVPEELEGTAFTTTVSLAGGGGVYITRKDAAVLWKALQHYNARYTQAVVALPQLVSTLAALFGPMAESESGSNDATSDTVPVAAQPPVGGVKVSKDRARVTSSVSN